MPLTPASHVLVVPVGLLCWLWQLWTLPVFHGEERVLKPSNTREPTARAIKQTVEAGDNCKKQHSADDTKPEHTTINPHRRSSPLHTIRQIIAASSKSTFPVTCQFVVRGTNVPGYRVHNPSLHILSRTEFSEQGEGSSLYV